MRTMKKNFSASGFRGLIATRGGGALFAAVFVGAALACAGVAAAQPGPRQGPGAGQGPLAVIVAPAEEKEVADRIEALGTLAARESVDVTATVTETVQSLHFADGQRVRKGDVLARLNANEEEALLVEARANVAEAEKQYERARQLARGGAAAAAQLDEARRVFETARARMVAIEARLAELVITAPFDGVTGLRRVSPGALARPGDVIVTLDDDAVMRLDFTVPSAFLGLLRPGLRITATTAAYGGREFEGVVSAVDSRVDPVTRAVTVRAEIPNADFLLKPGLLMTVELRGNERRSVVAPEGALMRQGEAAWVMVMEGGEEEGVARRRAVRTGRREAGEVEVVSGLKAGERVVVDGAFRLSDGARARVLRAGAADEKREAR